MTTVRRRRGHMGDGVLLWALHSLVCRLKTADGLWRSLVSALDWGSRGPGFKSRQPDTLTCMNDGHGRLRNGWLR
jgi:hypothetical protein